MKVPEAEPTDKTPPLRSNTLIPPKDVYKDSSKKEKDKGEGFENSKEAKDDSKPKNGPLPQEGISFENKSLLLYYKRQELCRSTCGLPLW